MIRPVDRRSRPGRPVRRALIACMATLAGLLAACAAPHPDVTFYGNRASALATPALWCDVDRSSLQLACPEGSSDRRAVVSLPLRKGDSVQVNVDGDLAAAPWWIYLQYADAKGTLQQGHGQLMTDHTLSTTVRLPDVDDQVVRLEVQSGFVPLQDGSYDVTRTWVMTNSLRG